MATRRKPQTDPSRAIAYIRVSTDDQALGVDAQRKAIKDWANHENVEVVSEVIERGVSGGAPLEKRTGLLRAIDELEAHRAGRLVVSKRDRLARDVVINAMIERLAERVGAKVFSVDGSGNGDSPESQLMRSMISIFAAYERALIRARTRAALATKRERGEKTGGRLPFGYRLAKDGKTLIDNAAEQRVIKRIRKLRADGLSQAAIAQKLNDERTPARGKRWHVTTIARLLRKD